MLRPALGIHEEDLERELLRKSVGALQADRTTCCDCGRTPLVGERIHRFAGPAVVCELCRGSHGGRPERSEVVLGNERGHTVRPRAA